ncbi:MAG TPA: anhydro-N-acetylmuramic acid kinase [Candidatus Acidoferrales bacterium]|nr:anhydro-N-acetylmuramic acid kinase [Candidatus Acidoferrales bacterium]
MTRRPAAMRVLGLMSGTSADAIDVALVRISGTSPHLHAQLDNFLSVPYPARVRSAILCLAEGGPATTAEISRMNFLLGELFARAALRACRKFRVSPKRIHLLGSHGQTVYHEGAPGAFLGQRVASTLQLAEPAIIAERTGITTVADFRPADIAAGGQGAPLVPFVDYLLCRDARRGRVALNIGGIANVTVIPARAEPHQVFAFDTGPGNMLVDALVRQFSRGRRGYDRDARMALHGRLSPGLLADLLRNPYFLAPPPKTAGREQFGQKFAATILSEASRRRLRPEDLLHTATLLTPLSIAGALRRFVLPRARVRQLIVSGGGARNPLMMAQLSAALPEIEILASSDLGIPTDAKEAFAFAILAYETFHGRANNLPSATGARHPAVLGKIVYARAR